MTFEIFAVCEKALAPRGSLTVIDVFDRITANKQPVKKSFCLAVRVRSENLDEPGHRFVVEMIDGDARQVIPRVEGCMLPARSGGLLVTTFVIDFDQIVFPGFGPYEINMDIAGRARMTLPLSVEPAQDPVRN